MANMIVISELAFVGQDQITCFLAHDGGCVPSVFFGRVTRLSSAMISL
jgi:hypothetical protein